MQECRVARAPAPAHAPAAPVPATPELALGEPPNVSAPVSHETQLAKGWMNKHWAGTWSTSTQYFVLKLDGLYYYSDEDTANIASLKGSLTEISSVQVDTKNKKKMEINCVHNGKSTSLTIEVAKGRRGDSASIWSRGFETFLQKKFLLKFPAPMPSVSIPAPALAPAVFASAPPVNDGPKANSRGRPVGEPAADAPTPAQPVQVVAVAAGASLRRDWIQNHDPQSQRKYFSNDRMRLTTWDPPIVVQWERQKLDQSWTAVPPGDSDELEETFCNLQVQPIGISPESLRQYLVRRLPSAAPKFFRIDSGGIRVPYSDKDNDKIQRLRTTGKAQGTSEVRVDGANVPGVSRGGPFEVRLEHHQSMTRIVAVDRATEVVSIVVDSSLTALPKARSQQLAVGVQLIATQARTSVIYSLEIERGVPPQFLQLRIANSPWSFDGWTFDSCDTQPDVHPQADIYEWHSLGFGVTKIAILHLDPNSKPEVAAFVENAVAPLLRDKIRQAFDQCINMSSAEISQQIEVLQSVNVQVDELVTMSNGKSEECVDELANALQSLLHRQNELQLGAAAPMGVRIVAQDVEPLPPDWVEQFDPHSGRAYHFRPISFDKILSWFINNLKVPVLELTIRLTNCCWS